MVIQSTVAILLSYILGSIPFGVLVVRLISGKDIRQHGSGRTGGTNAMRTAGFGAGMLTALLDVGKGFASGLIAHAFVPGSEWTKVLSAIAAIVGHIYSLFLLRRDEEGRLRFQGGAGGATCFGGAMAIWLPIFFILTPLAAAVFLLVGYASITTLSIALITLITFTIRFFLGVGAWQDILYGVSATIIVSLALVPNFKRLKEGSERLVGLRAYLLKRKESKSDK